MLADTNLSQKNLNDELHHLPETTFPLDELCFLCWAGRRFPPYNIN